MPYIHRYRGDDTEPYLEAYRADPGSLLRLQEDECRAVHDTITTFYADHLEQTGLEGYVIGLSGGIDSTTVAHLLVDAVGPESVHGVIMPTRHTRTEDVQHATETADALGITTNDPEQFKSRIDTIVNALQTLGERDPEQRKVKRGNILSRTRMIVLRDIAKARHSLVAGTTNASERDLGYMTLAGDGRGGIDNEGVANLYKTSERDLARSIGIDADIIEKAPTADLWQDQRDTDELQFSYSVIDQVLVGLRLGIDHEDIADLVTEVSVADVTSLADRVAANVFKRELAPECSF